MFNTLDYTKKLEAVDVPRSQAEAHVQMLTDVIQTNLATKQDMKDLTADLSGEMKSLATELRGEMKGLATELRGEMKALGTDLRGDMERLESRLLIKLGITMGAMITVATGVIALIIKSH
jgi:hypothetical protein